ncbi:MAG: hypothetical protein AAFN79_06455 [Pseudomonadota bacterium]
MTRRCLIVSDARPSATGASDWRRIVELATFHREAGFEVTALCLDDGVGRAADGEACAHLARIAANPAFARAEDAADAIGDLHRRFAFSIHHVAGPTAPARSDALLIAEGAENGGCEEDLRISFDRPETDDDDVIEAPLLRRAYRMTRARIPGARVLAGCWVEDEPRSIDAARGLFDAILTRGGGFAPNFAIAGPGAAKVAPPRLPAPVTVLEETAERVFYRGLDIALFPDAPTGATAHMPRYEALTALELGATPLVSESALTGIRSYWRLPSFVSLPDLAEYLLENGRALTEGGLMAELRARADWTWSGVAEAAGRQRRALADAIARKWESRVD